MEEKIGPTGKFPAGGPLAPGDRGGLKAAVSTDLANERVVVEFGTLLSFISGTPEEMLRFAELLTERARGLIAKRKG